MLNRSVKNLNEHLERVFGPHSRVEKEDLREARELLQDAERAGRIAIPYAQCVARKLNLPSDSVTDLNLKAINRIFEKAIGKLDGQIDEVPDIGRCRILIEGPDDVLALRQMYLDQRRQLKNPHPSNDITITEFEDFFYNPSKTGRIAIHIGLSVRLTDTKRVPFEIQAIHRDMRSTELITHSNYQKSEGIRRRATYENRPMTDDEQESVAQYLESNKSLYIADALRLGLYNLRHPRHMQGPAPDLVLAYAT